MRDFNAKIGAPRENEYLVMKQYGYGERNNSGQRLINFALENGLTIINTCFKKKQNRRWTWRSPNGQYKNEIDYILSNHPKFVHNIEVMNLNFASDHRPIRCKIKLITQKKNRTNFTNNKASQLKNEYEITKYKENLSSVLLESSGQLVSQENKSVQISYDKIKKAIQQSLIRAKSNIEDNKKHKILQERTLTLLKRRQELQKTKNKSRSLKNELSALYKLVNKYIKKDYAKYRQETIEKHLQLHSSSKRAYKENP